MIREVYEKLHGETGDPYVGVDTVLEDHQGWGSLDDSFNILIEKIKPRLIIEVGTWKGASAMNMARLALLQRPDVEIVCIDTWLGSIEHYQHGLFNGVGNRRHGRPTIYEQFLSNVILANLTHIITPFPMDSINAFECLRSWNIKADLIYIDAGHDYNSVRMDLSNYPFVLKDGGHLLMDDWHHEPIRQAAFDTFGEDKVFTVGGKAAWIK
jgi:Methyltransferase domain